MGAVNSCWLPRYRNPNTCVENHTSTPKTKGQRHRRNLSAAFNLAEIEQSNLTVELLNINMATEEELMTLPEINRATAHNIVDYRRQIGGFKKVEDLALVSGVGATKLNQIRMEISVGRKKSSQSSSRSSSKNDLSTQDNASSSSRRSHAPRSVGLTLNKVNVNTSNVFQLMKVKEISQTVAENIVVYRDRKGPYKRIDDLVKVKGMRPSLLSAIRPYLSLEEPPSGGAVRASEPDVVQQVLNGSALNATPASYQQQSIPSSHSRGNSSSGASVYNTSTGPHHLSRTPHNLTQSQDDLLSAYGPIVRKSFRKHKLSPVILRRHSRKVLRVAAWNLQRLSVDKADNPGVREVTCLTILENGVGIVAVQEVMEPEALHKICAELNAPTIPTIKRWGGVRGKWECVVSEVAGTLPQGGAEYLGFLYDTSQDLELVEAEILQTTTGTNRPYVGTFEVNGERMLVVNLHTEAELASVTVSDMATKIDEQMTQLRAVVVAGHLNLIHGTGPQLEERGYQGLVPSSVKGSNRVPPCILVNRCAHDIHTGFCDEVREGLTSPWIPDRWKWGGPVSAHRPVWAEFYSAHNQHHHHNGRTPSSGANTTNTSTTDHLHSHITQLKLASTLAGAGDGC